MSTQFQRQGSLLKARSFFTGRYSLTYDLKRNCTADVIKNLAQMLLSGLLPEESLHGGQLLNLKGRDPHPALFEYPRGEDAPAEELFFLGGWLNPEDEEIEDAKDEVPAPLPFSLTLSTSFAGFSKSNQIIHEVKCNISGPIERLEDLLPVLAEERARVEMFRLGMEFFEPKFVHAIFGLFPTATQTLLIEAASDTVAVQILAESLKSKDQLPLTECGLLDKLAAILAEAFGISLTSELQG